MNINTERMKIAMAEKCMSSRDLGNESGLAFSTICSYLKGKSQPSTKNLGLIAKALDVGVEELINH